METMSFLDGNMGRPRQKGPCCRSSFVVKPRKRGFFCARACYRRRMPKGARRETAKSMTLAKQREHDALELRTRGCTYDQISKALGITRQGAADCVKRALAALKSDTEEKAEEVRDLELRRLDKMLQIAEAAAEGGDLAAIDRVLRIQERRSKYLGLDAPAKSEIKSETTARVDLGVLDDRKLDDLERAYKQILDDDDPIA